LLIEEKDRQKLELEQVFIHIPNLFAETSRKAIENLANGVVQRSRILKTPQGS
jgi:hypothetical protein